MAGIQSSWVGIEKKATNVSKKTNNLLNEDQDNEFREFLGK